MSDGDDSTDVSTGGDVLLQTPSRQRDRVTR